MFSLAISSRDRAIDQDLSRVIKQSLASADPLASLAKNNLLGLAIPNEDGGTNRGELHLLMMLGSVARLDPSLSNILGVHTLVSYGCLARWGSSEQKSTRLPAMLAGEMLGAFAVTEEAAGSDVQSMTSSAHPEPGGYRLRGSKTYITASDRAGLFITTMRHVGGDLDGRISTFLVPAGEGVTVEALRPDGQRGSGLGKVDFDLWVPESSIVGDPGRGLRVVLSALDFDKIIAATSAAAIADRVLEETVAQLAERKQFGRPLLDIATLQDRVAKLTSDVFTIEALIRRAVDFRAEKNPRATLATSVAKATAAELGLAVVVAAGQLRGIRGYDEASGISSAINDLRGYALAGGTTEIQRVIVFRESQKLASGELGS